ncbi:hypothetical protein ILYODFUR_023745 [Ilyodon furcidens]|uniref:Uncharacterized protein n=1 Tax=Ilyodon furcidens TaxID=33524 RepID=A0ABV0V8G9_9TELE
METRADRRENAHGGMLQNSNDLTDGESEGSGDLQHPFSYKGTKQDPRFHGDQQTVILLKGLVGFLWCSEIGSLRCCRQYLKQRAYAAAFKSFENRIYTAH